MAAGDSILSICPRLRARLVGQRKDISGNARPGFQAEGVAGLEVMHLRHVADRLKCSEEIGDLGSFAGNAERAANPVQVAQAPVDSRVGTLTSVADKQGGAA